VSASPSITGQQTLTADRRDVPPQASVLPATNKLGRALWRLVHLILFRPSPSFAHGWRRFLLRLFGAKVAPTAHIYPSAVIWAPWNLTLGDYACLGYHVDVYSVAPVTIGARTTISQYTHLCAATHDYTKRNYPLITQPISIGEDCWLAADVFVGPGVTIGSGTVVGARSSVFSDLPPWVVAAGTPAKPIKPRVFEGRNE
jgi:putative colanic acid biosynthesis acetyltransferase WcaF